MELCVVTHTSVTDFMELSWRQIKLMREAYLSVMKTKAELEKS